MDNTGRNGLRTGDIHLAGFDQRHRGPERSIPISFPLSEIEFDLAAEEEKWMASLDTLRQLKQVDGNNLLHDALMGQRVLKGPGSLLILIWHSPFVTLSNTITAGVCTGSSTVSTTNRKCMVSPKPLCHGGQWPFPTELNDAHGEFLLEPAEFGSTTGSPRRCGWIDLPLLKYTIMLNGVTQTGPDQDRR